MFGLRVSGGLRVTVLRKLFNRYKPVTITSDLPITRTMSFQAAVSKLNSPIKELVLSMTHDGSEYIGQTESDQAEVASWIDKVARKEFVEESKMKNLDSLLVPRTYIATNYLTAADVALYGSLHPVFSQFKSQQYYALPSVTRYFNHIQSCTQVRASVESLASGFGTILFDLANAPKLERKAEATKKKGKTITSSAPVATSVSAPPADEGTQNKEKREKKKDVSNSGNAKKGGSKPLPADEGEPIPSMIDLRVGHIVDIIKHPDADGLYVEQIDLGEETGPRTVVSGLVNYIPIDQMRDKYLVAVCNLKPANMRGVKSFAMVLCATSKDGKEGGIELIQPPADSKPGDRVFFEGDEYQNANPLSQLNPKKKIFETIQPGFITLDSREAAWINPTTKTVHRIRTKVGVCKAPTLVGASLS